MVLSKKRFIVNRIRSNHSYTLAELAETCEVHTRTTQAWRKEGLTVLDESTKPLLVMGYDALKFLKDRIKKRRHPLGPKEFYCPHCRAARPSKPQNIQIERTGRRLGRATHQVIIRGRCDVCDCRVLRLSSSRQAEEWAENRPRESEQKLTLTGSEKPRAITDMAR